MNLVSRYQDLTRDEKEYLIAAINHFRLVSFDFWGLRGLPEIHHGNLIFVSYGKVKRLIEGCNILPVDEAWKRHQAAQIALIKKWALTPDDHVRVWYEGKL